MDIRKFGPGHRRDDAGPSGTRGVSGSTIYSDGRGLITELAFQRHALVPPHTNPNTAFFVVIGGAGYVQVGPERARINHGEAVMWPANELHGAFTDGTEMRAIVIEFAGENDDWARGVLEGTFAAKELTAPVTPGRGTVERATRPDEQVTSTGEPW